MEKLKLILMLFLVPVVLCCNSGKKDVRNPRTASFEIMFPEVENDLENPNLFNLTYDKHAFTSEIVFQEVNALETEQNIYSIIMVLDEELTNFEELQKWKVGMYIYPVYPEEFENEIDRKKGMRSIGVKAKPVMMGDKAVIVYKNIRLKPKSFENIRFYLYNKEEQTNLNYYKIRDIDFK